MPKQESVDTISEETPFGAYFHVMLNMYDDDLDPYQYRLLGHYKRVCGADNQPCKQGFRKISQHTKIGLTKIGETRQQLADLGLIILIPTDNPQRFFVKVADKMLENVQRYQKNKTVRHTDGEGETVRHTDSTVRHADNLITESNNPDSNKHISGAGAPENKKVREKKVVKIDPETLTPHQKLVRKVVQAMIPLSRKLTPIEMEEFLAGRHTIEGVLNPSKSEFSQWGKVATDLLAMGVQPEQVSTIWKYCSTNFRNKDGAVMFTVQALSKWARPALEGIAPTEEQKHETMLDRIANNRRKTRS